MAIAQVTAGSRILISDLNAFYNLLKGVSGSGEQVTLIYNNTGSVILQPSSDPAAGTELLQIKNAAGTVQGALSSDGKHYAADGTKTIPGFAFESDKDSGIYRVGSNSWALSAGDTKILTVEAAGLTDAIFQDDTDGNASTSAHGLLKKLSNTSTEFMNGQGNWATPAGGTTVVMTLIETTSATTYTSASMEAVTGLSQSISTASGTNKVWCYADLATCDSSAGTNTVRFRLYNTSDTAVVNGRLYIPSAAGERLGPTISKVVTLATGGKTVRVETQTDSGTTTINRQDATIGTGTAYFMAKEYR